MGHNLDSLLFWELKVWGLNLGLSRASSELGRSRSQAYLACPWALANLQAHSVTGRVPAPQQKPGSYSLAHGL